jgi:hypothetical protein
MVSLEGKLPAFLRGEEKPANNAERIALARLCRLPCKQLYAASARFWGDAFAANPQLDAMDQRTFRYFAATAAARAGSGDGKDTSALGEQEKSQLRKQALQWLREILDLRKKQFRSGKPQDRAAAQWVVRPWLRDTGFAGVREPAALAKLPEAERKEWQQFWADVRALLKP